MRTIIQIILCLLLGGTAFGQVRGPHAGVIGAAVGGGSTCELYESSTASGSSLSFGYSSSRVTGGQIYKAPEDISICRITVSQGKGSGDISGYNMVAEIYTLTTNNLTTLLGRSDSVACNNNLTAVDKTFTFATAVSPSSGTLLGLRICVDYNANGQCDSTDWDASNYANLAYGTKAAPLDDDSEVVARWDSSNNINGTLSNSLYLKVDTQ